MFKGALYAAAALSVMACLAWDVKQRVDLMNTQIAIEKRQAELQQYAVANALMQRRTNLLTQAKQFESTTGDAIAILHQQKLIQEAASRLGLQVTFK